MATKSAIRADIDATLFKSFVACKGSVPNFLDFCEAALSAVNHYKRCSKKMIFKNHNKTWKKKDNTLLMQLYKTKMPVDKMTGKLHRAPKAIEFHIAKCLLEEQHANGLTIAAMAKRYKCSAARIVKSIDVGQYHSKRIKNYKTTCN